ncbi:cysteinyl-tRNA synthetase [Marasmius fiardii PR-910]|nr:cysteinyl-tRNA synthetase [Marasmius fiardii PR-910]
MSAQQPQWSMPVPMQTEPVLKVYNSLTRTKTEFVPRNGRHVKWYNCGPTVYDASHMGHARNYVTQDVIRRIMSDYFGYDVHFVMNITDIDDKIIKRARQTHLLEAFRKDTTALSETLILQVQTAWRQFIRKEIANGLAKEDQSSERNEDEQWLRIVELYQNKDWRQTSIRRDERFDMNFSSANRAFEALKTAQTQLNSGRTDQGVAHNLIDESNDVLTVFLDEQYKATVTDPSLSRNLASYWEGRFFDDMSRLRVREPDTLTRVTEYVPEITAFIEKIVNNGYGYEVEGSVYFDIAAFDGAAIHDYAKLEPWSKGNREVETAEVSSSKSKLRSLSDFALWKASKPGEPSWPSPWGPGRPGWHIECSVMASAIFGDNMDIHSGGIDLAFPHHDNEMAQSEAYHECPAWVNYFLHTGHLHIEGLKMSKSLKNFITIDEILQRYSARQLRLAFLTQLWNAKVDFSESLMAGEVKNLETTLNNFFTTVKALVSQSRANGLASDGYHHYEQPEGELTAHFHETQSTFRSALCDSFNTPDALNTIRDIISRTNSYINSRGKNVNVGVVENIARWTGNMLRMFGLGEGESSEIGWGQERKVGESVDQEEVLMPYLRALSSFRDGVRKIAMAKGDSALKDILSLCDKLRDNDLVALGVALDDQEDGQALVKLVDPAELIRARDEKKAQTEAKAAKKAAAAEAERQKRLQRLEKGRVSPEQLFKPPNVPEGTYGSWDNTGLPLTDGDGKELSKNQLKKVQKSYADQRKLHEEFLAHRGELE